MKILVVDDHLDILKLLTTILEAKGFEVTTATNGKEGLDKLYDETFDLIISDIFMPVMDGFEFCRSIRKNEKFKDILFVFFTGTYTNEKDKEFALKLGADKFFKKPQDQKILIKTIIELSKSKKTERKNIQSKSVHDDKEVYKMYNERLVTKLEQNLIKVENEIFERKKIEELLRKSEERYRLIIENVPSVIWMTNQKGETLFISSNVKDIYGFTTEEIYEQGPDLWLNRIHPEDLEHVAEQFDLLFKKNKKYEVEYRVQRKDGKWIWLLDRASFTKKIDNDYFAFGVFSDVTERKQMESELHEKHNQQEKFLQIGRYLTESLDLKEVLNRIAEAAKEILQSKGCTIYLLEDDQRTLTPLIAVEEMDEDKIMSTKLNVDKSFTGQSIKKNKGLIFNDAYYNEHGFTIPDTEDREDDRTMAIPLVLENKVMGAMCLSREGLLYTENELALAETFATFASTAFKNAHSYNALEHEVEERKKVEESLTKTLGEIEQLKNQLQEENIYLREEIKLEHNFEEIIGKNSTLKKALHEVEQAAPTKATILILGETGTGKELIARAIHNLSPRKTKPLVKVNCAALPLHLIESELFGHEKGAFTGAIEMHKGRFELAEGGSIFLDEIGDLPLEIQIKLLRVIQEGEFERVGGTDTITVDVRVIAATNRDLEKAIQENKFRQDLFYRLNVFPIKIPPLRERIEDIPLLVDYFINKHSQKLGKKIERISKRTVDILQSAEWPGNIRELENEIERALIFSNSSTLQINELNNKNKNNLMPAGTLEDVERNYIIQILDEKNWKISGKKGAASVLGLKESTLRAKMKKLNIRRRSTA